jgi:large subunit ribosomal protein L32
MGLPGHRRTSSHKRRRASHFALKKQTLAACPKCKAPVLPHVVCKDCGAYGGRQVIELKNPLVKKAAKAKTAKGKKAEGKEEKKSAPAKKTKKDKAG